MKSNFRTLCGPGKRVLATSRCHANGNRYCLRAGLFRDALYGYPLLAYRRDAPALVGCLRSYNSACVHDVSRDAQPYDAALVEGQYLLNDRLNPLKEALPQLPYPLLDGLYLVRFLQLMLFRSRV